MDKAAEEPPAADPAASTFSQVVFTDIPPSYPPSTSVTCRYTYSTTFQPNSRDWVGIFKVGWSTIKDYHTFIWVEQEEGQMSSQAVFKEYYLPKDEIEFYQFCYVDSSGQVRGASTPFCFRSAAEQSMESISSFDALFVTTQEQVEQNLREKDKLQEELLLMRSENETLRGALQKQQKETASFKEWNDQKEEERSKLTYQMDQIKAENEQLKIALQLQQQENEQLKKEMVIQLTKQMVLEQQDAAEQKAQSRNSCRTAEDKYDRALLKINQLKEERDSFKKNTDAQNEELAHLKARLREEERVLSKAKDSIQLLQADLLSSEKEKERLSTELLRLQNLNQTMDRMKKENLELSWRLSQQDTMPNPPQDGVETLRRQLQDTRMKLEAESQECKKANGLIEHLSNELQQVKQQLINVASLYDLEQRKTSKYEMQISEMNEMLADRDILAQEREQEFRLLTQQKEELTRENEGLKSDIEKVRESIRTYGSIGTTSADSTYMQFDVTSPSSDTNTTREQEDESEQNQHVYETIGPIEGQQEEEPSLVCHHCQERFPGITQEELEQHEQSHRVCPFCTMICDGMEQSVFEDHVYGHEL